MGARGRPMVFLTSDERKAQRQLSQKKYRNKNKEKIAEAIKKWRIDNPNYLKNWQENNPDKLKKYKEDFLVKNPLYYKIKKN